MSPFPNNPGDHKEIGPWLEPKGGDFDRLMKRLGKDVRSLRTGWGLTQANMRELGFSNSLVSRLELGKNNAVSLYTVWSVARALGYDMKITFERNKKRGLRSRNGARFVPARDTSGASRTEDPRHAEHPPVDGGQGAVDQRGDGTPQGRP